jgi:mannose-6-phosphate isomerase-like protein (cupin superfamily)
MAVSPEGQAVAILSPGGRTTTLRPTCQGDDYVEGQPCEKLAQFSEQWKPKIVGELNGQHVKLAKILGEFIWHKHDNENELFLVVKGRFRMEFRDRHVWLEEGEILIVPRGVEHGLSPRKKPTSSCSSWPRR